MYRITTSPFLDPFSFSVVGGQATCSLSDLMTLTDLAYEDFWRGLSQQELHHELRFADGEPALDVQSAVTLALHSNCEQQRRTSAVRFLEAHAGLLRRIGEVADREDGE